MRKGKVFQSPTFCSSMGCLILPVNNKLPLHLIMPHNKNVGTSPYSKLASHLLSMRIFAGALTKPIGITSILVALVKALQCEVSASTAEKDINGHIVKNNKQIKRCRNDVLQFLVMHMTFTATFSNLYILEKGFRKKSKASNGEKPH